MEALLIALLAAAGFIVAYNTYGRWLGGKIFALSSTTVCPSTKHNDGVDFVPTDKHIVFGHHFTSIAGTGPIVGPAIAIMWGWLPALLWVVFGSIFIGAVHDFGALVVSMRNEGKTVGEIAGRVINPRVRLLFLLTLFMALTIVLAIFGLVIASVFRLYPASIFPCLAQIPLAIAIGYFLHRKGAKILLPSVVALVIMYLTVVFGGAGPLGAFNEWLASWPILTWVVVLLVYSYVASVLPVWTLLQPRDFINSLQLVTALGLIVLGLVIAAIIGGAPNAEGTRPALRMVAPMAKLNPEGAPIVFPFLFITIACGAISGFHCLVSSGTTSKQLKSEPDARFVGYGGMLLEGFLATLVILACAAGLGLGIPDSSGGVIYGTEAWEMRYSSWAEAGALGKKVGAFVDGAANFLVALGLGPGIAVALMGVLVASFAGTTLDTACRLQRYVIQELARLPGKSKEPASGVFSPLAMLRNKHGATLFAILVAAVVAALPDPASMANPEYAWQWNNAGKGGLALWPLFGATNQLLGGLAFMVITFYLWRRGKSPWFLVLPMVFMLIIPAVAMIMQLFTRLGGQAPWVSSGNVALIVIAFATLALEAWMIVEALLLYPKVKGQLELVPEAGSPMPQSQA